MSILEVNGLKKVYTTRLGGNKVEALKNVTFSVEQGEYVAIMGESGSGKTTLLNILAALDKPTSGTVLLDGRDIGKIKESSLAAFRRDHLGFVFQDFNLLDTFSLEDNIYLPLVLAGKSYREMQQKIAPIAERLAITDILKKYVLPNLPYLLFLWIFAKVGEAVRLAPGIDASTKLLGLADGFALTFQTTMPGAAIDWLVGLAGAVVIRLAVYIKGKNARKYRKNVEYGSARWGTKSDIAPFMDPKPENNIILTQTEGLMMSGRPKNPAHARNKNVLVVGGSGSGDNYRQYLECANRYCFRRLNQNRL